jgi:hypothetical protein
MKIAKAVSDWVEVEGKAGGVACAQEHGDAWTWQARSSEFASSEPYVRVQ